jgi:hypothetical protein
LIGAQAIVAKENQNLFQRIPACTTIPVGSVRLSPVERQSRMSLLGKPKRAEKVNKRWLKWQRRKRSGKVGFALSWRRYGMDFVPSWGTTSENFLHFWPMATALRVRLLTDKTMRSQFLGLERRATANGLEKVGHLEWPNYHDDMATAVAGCVAEIARSLRRRAA